MQTDKVGQYNNPSFQRRNFFDQEYRNKIIGIIKDFIRISEIDIQEDIENGWRNIGREDDIHEIGVALRVSQYEIRYKLVAEDFSLVYYDIVDPKCIVELEENNDSIEPVMIELFKNLGEDQARRDALFYCRGLEARNEYPIYPDEPKPKRQEYSPEQIKRYMSKT